MNTPNYKSKGSWELGRLLCMLKEGVNKMNEKWLNIRDKKLC